MAIEIICDDCGNKYRVSDDKAGSRVRCKECGARIDVPEDVFDDDTEVRSKPSSKRRKKSKEGPSAGVLIGVGAVVVVLLIGMILFFTMTGKNPNAVALGNPPAPLPNSNPGGVPPIPAVGVTPGNVTPNSTFPATTPNANAGTLPANILPGSGLPMTNTPAPNPVAGTPAGAGLPATQNTPANATPRTPAAAPIANTGFGGFTGASDPALDLPPPDNWKVQVDPTKLDFKIPEETTINLKIPKGGEHNDVVYPASPSAFVAIGNNENDKNVREIWNLATKQKVGSITGGVIDRSSRIAALSPDGQHFAAGLGFRQKGAIIVFPAKGSKSLGELESGGDRGVVALMFTSPERLFALNGDGSAKTWKIPSGEVEHEMQLGTAREPFHVAVSPGGKYLAAITAKNTLQVFDLETAESVGEVGLPSGDDFWEFNVDAMSFSPDGVELGLTGEVFSKGVFLLRYNVADGKLLAKAPLNKENVGHHSNSVKTNRLEWFADRSKLLWKGHYVLDAKLGGPVWNAPEENGSSDAPRKLLDSKRILIAYGGRQNAGLKTAPVPSKEIEAAAQVVAAGGEASDAGLPTISKVDYDGAMEIAPIAANWTMQPDPSPAGNTVKSSIPLPKERPSVGAVFISRPSINRGLVWYTDDGIQIIHSKGLNRFQANNNVPENLKGTCLTEVYDLAKGGKAVANLQLPYKSAILDACLDGEHVLAKTTKPNEERVDIYNVMTGKHIAGWRPYQLKEHFLKNVTGGLLIDSQHCLTQNQQGSIYMWKLPECKAIWHMKDARNFTVSPGGKYLGFLSESRYLFMDPRTGELVGEVPAAMPNISCAFHPMGTHVAILGSDTVSRKVIIVDVATGKSTADFYVPQGNDSIQWCGDTQVLLDNAWLVDLKQQKNGWRYVTESGVHAKTQPDGRHWYISNAGPLDQNMTLSCATIPEKAVADKIAAAQLPDESLLKPGMQLNLQVNLTAAMPQDRPNLAQEVGTWFDAGLRKHGFEVGAAGPYTMTITTSQANTGRNMEFRSFGLGPGTTTVPVVEVKCEVALIANGQAVWKHTHTVSNSTFGIVHLAQGEDVTTHLSKQMWSGMVNHLTKFPVPAQVFGATAGAGLGQSKFVAGGVQPLVGR